jgi:hypothetical protein
MHTTHKRRLAPSPALVIACLALAFSLAGTGYAVTALPKNSVGTAQMQKNAIVSAKVKDGSLRAVDFATGQVPAGPAGPVGPTGPAGPQGVTGPQGPSGVVSGSTIVGGGLNPTSTLQFFGAPVTVTIPSAQARVWVVADHGFGAGGLGANSLNLWACYRQGSGALTPVGNGILGMRLAAGERVSMGINKILELTPGTYTVGMCGTGGTGWTNNDWGATTALVFTHS